MEFKGLTLDPFQEDAIRAIEENKSVVVSAPTGSGKTIIADYIIDRDVKKGVRVLYTAPIKALSNQKYKDFCKDYGAEKVGMLTGDVAINPNAQVVVMTTEVYRNMVLTNDPAIADVSYVVFDEVHYINDVERGYVWEESLIFSKEQTRFLCLSATIPNAGELADWIASIQDHDVIVVSHHKRSVPLHVKFFDSELGLCDLRDIKEVADIPDYKHVAGRKKKRLPRVKPPHHLDLVKEIKDSKTPCLFFEFSRKGCQKSAAELLSKKPFAQNPEISSIIRKRLEQTPKEINQLESTQLLRQCLPHGIGFHHAGLLPVMKDIVEELFEQGLLHVLYTTETFAVGINMPAKAVCMKALRKFDGRQHRLMNSKEFFQMAGRAGRRGLDDEGFVYVMVDRRDFDYKRIDRLTSKDTEPIRSQFRISMNTVLNLVRRHTHDEIHEILDKSLFAFQQHGSAHRGSRGARRHQTYQNLRKKLEKLGYIQGDNLTEKGEFASYIYADELPISELFGTELYGELSEYQMLLAVACLCYEARERTKIFKTYPSKDVTKLKKTLQKNKLLAMEKRFTEVENLTGLIKPCYDGRNVFEAIDNTNLLEGDIIRLFRQMVDRLSQIKMATRDHWLGDMAASCQRILNDAMAGIDAIGSPESDVEEPEN